MVNHSKSIATFGKNWTEIIGVVHEKFDIIELIAPVKLSEKPPCYLFFHSRIEAQMKDFARVRIDRAVQSELLTVEVDHLFVNRKRIRRNCRDRL